MVISLIFCPVISLKVLRLCKTVLAGSFLGCKADPSWVPCHAPVSGQGAVCPEIAPDLPHTCAPA